MKGPCYEQRSMKKLAAADLTKGLESIFLKLHILPSTPKLVVILASTLLIYTVATWSIVKEVSKVIRSSFTYLYCVLTMLVLTWLLAKILDITYMNLRRALGLTTVLTLSSLPLSILANIVSTKVCGHIILIATIYPHSVISVAFHQSNSLTMAFLYSYLVYLPILITSALTLTTSSQIILITTIYVTSPVLTYLLYRELTIKCMEMTKIPTFDLISAFLKWFFENDGSDLERVLTTISTTERREATVIEVLPENSSKIAVVPLPYHPGPFRGVGGAYLVPTLYRKLRDLGYVPIVLHSEGSHELDLVSREDVDQVVSKLATHLTTCSAPDTELVISSKIITREEDDFKIEGLILHKVPLIFIERISASTDDIPLDIANTAKKLANATHVIIVDNQNKLTPIHPPWTEQEIHTLSRCISHVVTELTRSGVVKCEVSALTLPKEAIRGVSLDLCEGGVSVLYLRNPNYDLAIVVIDGNNMVPGLREYIQESVRRELGVTKVLVVTTDSHEISGVKVSNRAYAPVGLLTEWNTIASTVIELVRKCKESCRRAKVRVHRVALEARVLGRDTYIKLTKLVEIGWKITVTKLVPTTFTLASLLVLSTVIT